MPGKAQGFRDKPGPSRTDVWQMFDRMAPQYDLINHLISFGRDRSWRRKAASLVPPRRNQRVLDLATGTADQLLFLLKQGGRVQSVIGMDMAERMLDIGRRKIERQGLSAVAALTVGSAIAIPAADKQFDVVTISFGIRNVTDVSEALKEMYRVLRPGGRLLVLDFSLPDYRLIQGLYLFYLRYVLPRVAVLLRGDLSAYRYLNETIEAFPCGEAFCDMLRTAGFTAIAVHPMTFGVVTVYQGDRPAIAPETWA